MKDTRKKGKKKKEAAFARTKPFLIFTRREKERKGGRKGVSELL